MGGNHDQPNQHHRYQQQPQQQPQQQQQAMLSSTDNNPGRNNPGPPRAKAKPRVRPKGRPMPPLARGQQDRRRTYYERSIPDSDSDDQDEDEDEEEEEVVDRPRRRRNNINRIRAGRRQIVRRAVAIRRREEEDEEDDDEAEEEDNDDEDQEGDDDPAEGEEGGGDESNDEEDQEEEAPETEEARQGRFDDVVTSDEAMQQAMTAILRLYGDGNGSVDFSKRCCRVDLRERLCELDADGPPPLFGQNFFRHTHNGAAASSSSSGRPNPAPYISRANAVIARLCEHHFLQRVDLGDDQQQGDAGAGGGGGGDVFVLHPDKQADLDSLEYLLEADD